MQSWTRVRELFQHSLELEGEERAGFVRREAREPEVRDEVLRLLEHVRDDDSFLTPPTAGRGARRDRPRALPGRGRDPRSAARLALLREVCAAVHHAHQRGVIHRDLKPSNILVDASGRAKVIDYGVARAEVVAVASEALAGVPIGQGRTDEATAALEACVERMVEGGLAQHPRMVKPRGRLGTLYQAAGLAEDALRELETAVRAGRATLPETQLRFLEARCSYGLALLAAGRTREAERGRRSGSCARPTT